MKKLALILVFGLVSCKSVDGLLTVDTSFELINEDNESIHIPKGQYLSEFEFKPNKEKIEVDIKDINSNDEEDFEFRTLKSFKIPRTTTTLSIPSEESGQPIDIFAKINVSRKTSRPYSHVESCGILHPTWIYTYPYYTCPFGYSYHGGYCYGRYNRFGGWRHIEYRNIEETHDLDLTFNKPVTGQKVASFKGKEVNTYRDYMYVGACYYY